MNMRTAPNWDNFLCRKMSIPFFIYGRDDLQVGPLEGFCRGCGGEKSYQDTIGVYTSEGVYFNVVNDTRVKAIVPSLFIDDEPFYYPIVACLSMCGGLPVIDPATGIMRTPTLTDRELSK